MTIKSQRDSGDYHPSFASWQDGVAKATRAESGSSHRVTSRIGRGQRREANGGKETCRIVTVLDNLDRFAELHPYHYCRGHFGDGRE